MSDMGKLIVFEGPDGVGKTALSHKVTEYLNEIGIPCSYYAFPGRKLGTLGWHVYKLHHDPSSFGVDRIDSISLQLMHIAAHIDAIEHDILPMLKAGVCVVLDRFWWSTWVYGVVNGARHQSLRAALQVEHEEWATVLPFVVYLISRTEPFRKEHSVSDWNKLSSAYKILAEAEEKTYPVEVINNDREIDHVVHQIVCSISEKTNRAINLSIGLAGSSNNVAYIRN